MLKKFQMEDNKPIITPMVTSRKLSKDDDSKEVDQSWYRSMIGILMYVTTSRPEIIQVVGMVARFQSGPKEAHALVVKIIFRYLNDSLELSVWYPRYGNLSFTTYSDVDWANSVDDQKSTSGCAFFLGNYLVAWLNNKEASISLSTTEAEYIAIIKVLK